MNMPVQINTVCKISPIKIQVYEPKPKQYCCLYHYLQGKKTKGITPCNNHVSLGVINPLTTLTLQQKQKIKNAKINKYRQNLSYQTDDSKNLVVNADPYDMNFHTHFINEIQKRGSMPRQLTKPRVYVQKIFQRNYSRRNQAFLYPKNENKKQYRQIYKLYKIFAQKTKFTTQKELKDEIIKFSRQNNIKTINYSSLGPIAIAIDKSSAAQYLFSKQNFLNFLIYYNLSEQSAQSFWEAAYNRDRFIIPEKSLSNLAIIKNEFVSMKAFTYNFKKFYLQEQEYYKNVFSEPAFRQRLIDLRLGLQPWFHKNIILKHKMKKWKKTQLEVAEFLKKSGYENEFQQIIKTIQDRNRLFFLMRTLAKSFYDLTDQKNFGMDVWNNRVTYLVQEKSDSLICFMQFKQLFFQHLISQGLQNPQTLSNQFKITSLLQFLSENKSQYTQLQQKWLLKWIRNIYKYLYTFKQNQQLFLDQKTFKLCCSKPISIEKQLVQEFIHFRSNQSDSAVEVLTSLTEQIEERFGLMPQLQGRKKYLVECNYLTLTLLRIIRKNNFSSFQTLFDISKVVQDHWFDFQNCYQQIIDIIRNSQTKSKSFFQQQKFWKQLFTFRKNQTKNNNISRILQDNQQYNYKKAVDKYQNVKNALGIKSSLVNEVMNRHSQGVNRGYHPKQSDKQISNLPKKAGYFLQKLKRDELATNNKIQQLDQNLTYKYHQRQNCFQSYCLLCNGIISTQIGSTISKVQDMENYLMDLLRQRILQISGNQPSQKYFDIYQ